MSDEFTTIIDRAGDDMVKSAVGIIRDDIESLFSEELQFAAEGEGLGEMLIGVYPITNTTVQIKRSIHAPFPERPRFRWGTLAGSITPLMGHQEGFVIVGDSDGTKVEYQQSTRPFFGISARAMEQVNKDVEQRGIQLVSELDKVQLTPVEIHAAG